jgi:RimJ/RimL family protein N-acetyltransferase
MGDIIFGELAVGAPSGLETREFILRPIRASDAELDYEAVMESREFLRKWEQSTWPEDDFTLEANRQDMLKLERRHASGGSFTYTVMNLDQTECLGCVYVFSPEASWFSDAHVLALGADEWSDSDAMIFFWVRKSRLSQGMDRSLLDSLLTWFEREWSFDAPVVMTNEHFDQQVAMIERTDLRRRFEVKLSDNLGKYLAYA